MFNTIGIEAVICAVGRGCYKFQDTFLENTQTVWISNRFVYIVPFNYFGRKKKIFEEIMFKIKKRYISRRSCVMRGGLKS